MFQWSEAEVLGNELPIILEQDQAEFRYMLSELASGQQLNGLERKRARKDGKLTTCATWTAPLRSPGGNITGSVVVLADVSERKRAEEQTRKHLQYLATSQRELEEFAWAASHCLQEPARLALSRTETVEQQWSGLLPAPGQNLLREGRSAISQVEALVSGLREYWELQHKSLNTKLVALESILDSAIATLAMDLSANGAKVTCSHLPDVMGDRELLTQLFLKLLENSLKFRSPQPPEIHVSAEALDQSWVVRVQDNGIGMQSYDSNRAFRLFERLARDGPGVGVGLSLAQQIMKRHDGDIAITSQPNGGTTVYLTFKRPA
jgi:PAS domain S-box-containing protein